MKITMVSCPACQASISELPIRRFGSDEAAQHFILAQEYPDQHAALAQHIEGLWRATHCSLLGCPSCGLQFAWPFVAGDAEFYNLAYPHTEYPSRRWEFDETARSLASEPLAEGRILELGSGFGHFLCRISPRFVPKDRVVAIEFNDHAREILKRRGYLALAADVRSDELLAFRGQFAALFMFQVLEHMDRLDELVSRLAVLLRPGADIFIAVPNIQRIAYNESHGSLLDMPPNHISRWTEAALHALGERAGWEIAAYRVEPVSWLTMMKQDLVYSHMRRSQRRGSLANWIRGRERTPVRVALEGVFALAAAPARAAGWLRAAARGTALGDSVWVHFRSRRPRSGA